MDGNDKPTVVIVENGLGFTGAFKAILQIAEDLSDQYRFVFVIPKDSDAVAYLRDKNIKFYAIPYFPLQKQFKSILLYIPGLLLSAIRLKRIIIKEQASILHANDIYNLSTIIVKLFYPRVKLITHVRILKASFPPVIYGIWTRLTQRFSDIIVGVSEVALSPFGRDNRIRLIYDGVFQTEKHPYNYEVHPSTINLLYLANYIQGKGQDLAIESFALVCKQKRNVRLTFVGDTFKLPANEKFKLSIIKKARELDVADSVVFKEFSVDVEKEFKESSIFLNLSEAESFSFTCLESLYYGIPCIATASGGPQEILNNGEYGVLIYERNKHKIAYEILKLINDPDQRLLFSKKGRLYARKVFSPKNTSDRVREIYSQVRSY